MSAPIHSLLADELDISEETSEKLLSAMLREVRKRARQGQKGVRLPDFGKFIVEDGDLTFYPTDALRRAVNHRFEGLESEDLSSAPQSGDPDEDESGGPSTIRLGYQDKGWNPIEDPAPDDASDADAATEEPSATPEDDGADTEEFQSPSPDPGTSTEASDPEETSAPSPPGPEDEPDESRSEPPPTEEVSSPEPEAPDPNEPTPPASEVETPTPEDDPDESENAPSSPSSPDDETEKLYPLVDEMSDEPATEPESTGEAEPGSEGSPPASPDDETTGEGLYDQERDALSEIWNDDSDDDPDESDAESMFDDATSPRPSETEDSEAPSTEEPASADDRDTAAWDFETTEEPVASDDDALLDDDAVADESTEEPQADSVREPPRPETESSSGALRALVTVLVLVLLGGGAWYILGQRGMVPSPGQTFAQLSGQTAAPESGDSATAGSAASDESSSSEGTSGDRSPSSSEGDPEASGGTTADASPQQGLDPSAGGWTVVVASRNDRGTATDLVETYRQRLTDRNVPVDLIEGTVDGSTRYRVGVGQFGSQIEAETFLDANGSSLPDGAWPLELE